MRGPHFDSPCKFSWQRITPAYAGTTHDRKVVLEPVWDHPRLCGDHRTMRDTMDVTTGSPPLMRGPLCAFLECPRDIGITPAYAGTTSTAPLGWSRCKDHPRLCGDHSSVPYCPDTWVGSPPLMRGPHVLAQDIRAVRRITPAYAGTTCAGARYPRGPTDHPRLCGDHRPDMQVEDCRKGSPPLMRGPPAE